MKNHQKTIMIIATFICSFIASVLMLCLKRFLLSAVLCGLISAALIALFLFVIAPWIENRLSASVYENTMADQYRCEDESEECTE